MIVRMVCCVTLATVLCGAASAQAAFQFQLQWDFDANPGRLPNPIPPNPDAPFRWALFGFAGQLEGHVVVVNMFPFKENADFGVAGFVGFLTLSGPGVPDLGLGCSEVSLVAIEPTNVMAELHYGPERGKPLLTMLADRPMLLVCDGQIVGEVQASQVVGGRIVFLK